MVQQPDVVLQHWLCELSKIYTAVKCGRGKGAEGRNISPQVSARFAPRERCFLICFSFDVFLPSLFEVGPGVRAARRRVATFALQFWFWGGPGRLRSRAREMRPRGCDSPVRVCPGVSLFRRGRTKGDYKWASGAPDPGGGHGAGDTDFEGEHSAGGSGSEAADTDCFSE